MYQYSGIGCYYSYRADERLYSIIDQELVCRNDQHYIRFSDQTIDERSLVHHSSYTWSDAFTELDVSLMK